jgi:multidrug resistance efflux pump
MEPLAPIPTPPAQRWREFRIQALPLLTFLLVLTCIVVLWRNYVLPTNIVGEVESMNASVISAVPGTIKEIKVQRFQRVKAGDEIAVISTMDTEVLQASLRNIEANLKLMRARMQIDVERNENSYQQLRLEDLKERVDLELERVNAYYYKLEAQRLEQLVTNQPPLIDRTAYEVALRLAEGARTNVVHREQYLATKEQTLPRLVPAVNADQAILDAIKAEQEQLMANAATISLKAPFDGMVSQLLHHPGEKIVPNMPIAVIGATSASRIIGYVRKPYSTIPKPGDTVKIVRQSFKREEAQGKVLDVGGQLEGIALSMVPRTSSGTNEIGLPFSVSIPAEMALIPGEPVDLIFNKR